MGVCCVVFDIDGMLFEFFYEFFKYWKKNQIKFFCFQFHVFFAFHAISNIKQKIGLKRALCPIRALRYSLSRTNFSDPSRSKRLFVSIKPGRQKDIAKTTISGWIKGIIRSAYSEAKSEDIPHLTSQMCRPENWERWQLLWPSTSTIHSNRSWKPPLGEWIPLLLLSI